MFPNNQLLRQLQARNLDDEDHAREDAGEHEEGAAHQEGQVEPTNLEQQSSCVNDAIR
jgi:hypothetical protein